MLPVLLMGSKMNNIILPLKARLSAPLRLKLLKLDWRGGGSRVNSNLNKSPANTTSTTVRPGNPSQGEPPKPIRVEAHITNRNYINTHPEGFTMLYMKPTTASTKQNEWIVQMTSSKSCLIMEDQLWAKTTCEWNLTTSHPPRWLYQLGQDLPWQRGSIINDEDIRGTYALAAAGKADARGVVSEGATDNGTKKR